MKNGCCDDTCICLKQGSMKWKAKMYICARCFETQPFLPLCTILDATTQILPLWLQTCTPIGKPYFLLIVGCHNRFPLSYEKKGICLHNKKYTCFFLIKIVQTLSDWPCGAAHSPSKLITVSSSIGVQILMQNMITIFGSNYGCR